MYSYSGVQSWVSFLTQNLNTTITLVWPPTQLLKWSFSILKAHKTLRQRGIARNYAYNRQPPFQTPKTTELENFFWFSDLQQRSQNQPYKFLDFITLGPKHTTRTKHITKTVLQHNESTKKQRNGQASNHFGSNGITGPFPCNQATNFYKYDL